GRPRRTPPTSPPRKKSHPSAAAPILEVAAALKLPLQGNKTNCFDAAAHRDGHDRTPSLALYPDGNHFHCFGCGAHGDVIDLVQAVPGYRFEEAVAWLEPLLAGCPSGPAPTRAAVASPSPSPVPVYRALYDLATPPSDTTPAGRYLWGRY